MSKAFSAQCSRSNVQVSFYPVRLLVTNRARPRLQPATGGADDGSPRSHSWSPLERRPASHPGCLQPAFGRCSTRRSRQCRKQDSRAEEPGGRVPSCLLMVPPPPAMFTLSPRPHAPPAALQPCVCQGPPLSASIFIPMGISSQSFAPGKTTFFLASHACLSSGVSHPCCPASPWDSPLRDRESVQDSAREGFLPRAHGGGHVPCTHHPQMTAVRETHGPTSQGPKTLCHTHHGHVEVVLGSRGGNGLWEAGFVVTRRPGPLGRELLAETSYPRAGTGGSGHMRPSCAAIKAVSGLTPEWVALGRPRAGGGP